MKKQKLKLEDLKIKSFITNISKEDAKKVKGGKGINLDNWSHNIPDDPIKMGSWTMSESRFGKEYNHG